MGSSSHGVHADHGPLMPVMFSIRGTPRSMLTSGADLASFDARVGATAGEAAADADDYADWAALFTRARDVL
jgi:hypothetical protein